jgi:hypothetical protein
MTQVVLDTAEGDLSSFRLYELGERYSCGVRDTLSRSHFLGQRNLVGQ